MTKAEPDLPQTDARAAARKLALTGLLAEADACLAEAVAGGEAALPDQLEWIRLAAVRGDHDTSLLRLGQVKAAMPGPAWDDVEIELRLRARQFEAAATLLKGQIAARGAEPQRVRKLAEAEALRSIVEGFAASPHPWEGVHAYCINLDQFPQKWDRCLREAGHAGLRLIRVAGVRGSDLATRLLPRFGRKINVRFKGTLGCFLSHFHAWEQFLSSAAPVGLFLEEDYRPLVSFPSSLQGLGLPGTFDVCWLNQGMATARTGPLVYQPVTEMTVLRAASPGWTACGTYGYALSRQGAERLLERVSEDGFFGDVDWRLLAYALDAATLARLPAASFARQAMAAHFEVMKPRKPLIGFAASLALIGHENLGSPREAQNQGRHVHEFA